MPDNEYKYIKNVFRISRAKPKTYEDLRKIYISMLRNVTTNDLITGERSKKRNEGQRDKMMYEVDNDYIQYHLELNKFSNPDCLKFHEHFVKQYSIPVKQFTFREDHIDEDELNEMCRIFK